MGVTPKIPKMDGENHGKPYKKWDDLGVQYHHFRVHRGTEVRALEMFVGPKTEVRLAVWKSHGGGWYGRDERKKGNLENLWKHEGDKKP